LHGIATGNRHVLSNLHRICRCNALLKVIINLDPITDRAELTRLGIATFDLDYVRSVLTDVYQKAGFEIMDVDVISDQEYLTLQSSWAKRIHQNKERLPIYFLARAKK
jgi:hypothetical protein